MTEKEFEKSMIRCMVEANKPFAKQAQLMKDRADEVHFSKMTFENSKETFLAHSEYIWDHIREESFKGNYLFDFSKEDIEKETGYKLLETIDEMKIISYYFCYGNAFDYDNPSNRKHDYGFQFRFIKGVKKCYEISWADPNNK